MTAPPDIDWEALREAAVPVTRAGRRLKAVPAALQIPLGVILLRHAAGMHQVVTVDNQETSGHSLIQITTR